VRDINAAFKELAKLCAQHMPNTEERGLTKLGTLLKAVDLIPLLEAKVRILSASIFPLDFRLFAGKGKEHGSEECKLDDLPEE